MAERSASGAGSDKTAKSKADAAKDARAKDSHSAVKSEMAGSGSHSSPKKRRKVNHGKFFLRAACDREPGIEVATGVLVRLAIAC